MSKVKKFFSIFLIMIVMLLFFTYKPGKMVYANTSDKNMQLYEHPDDSSDMKNMWYETAKEILSSEWKAGTVNYRTATPEEIADFLIQHDYVFYNVMNTQEKYTSYELYCEAMTEKDKDLSMQKEFTIWAEYNTETGMSPTWVSVSFNNSKVEAFTFSAWIRTDGYEEEMKNWSLVMPDLLGAKPGMNDTEVFECLGISVEMINELIEKEAILWDDLEVGFSINEGETISSIEICGENKITLGFYWKEMDWFLESIQVEFI